MAPRSPTIMEPAIARGRAPVVFEDGLGSRHHTLDAGAQPVEVLTLRREITAVAPFEFALRERVSRLAGFRHPCYAHVRGVERVERGSMLAIVSDHTAGIRLSNLLAVAGRELIPLEIEAGLCLIRQIVEAVALLHEMPDIAHGAIAAERIIITPTARLVLAEHVLGAALTQLQYSRERYWQELRVALPARAGLPRVDRRADVTQVGVIALSLILGRPLEDDDYPNQITEIAGRIGAVSSGGGLEPLPVPFRSWLSRALQIDPRNAFASAIEARAALDAVLGETEYGASPAALESFLMQYNASVSRVTPPPAPSQKVHPSSGPRIVTSSQPPDARAEQEPEVATPTRPPSSRRRFVAMGVALIALASAGTLAARRFLAPTVVADTTGTLMVNTNPVGVPIIVDGQARGTTPLSVRLSPGDHVFELVTGSDRRSIPVTITAGGQVSQFIEMPKAPSPVVPLKAPEDAPLSGWISISAPVDVRVYENQLLLGSSKTSRIMVPVGRHDLEFVNEALGYRATRTVTIQPGQVSGIKIDMPMGALSINALPWAEVWIDGERVGETPIGNVILPIGPHEVIFRHPDLGEKRRAITVTMMAPARVSVDLRKR
jgi:serine/threonine protein kinase